MNSTTYSAIPVNPSIELQPQDLSLGPQRENTNWVAIKNLSSIEDHEEDDFPLILEETKDGSGIPGAVFNLSTTVIGAGIMALPATMKVLGVPLGFAVIILMGIVSEISIEILVKFSALKNASSYGDIIEFACGHGTRVISDLCIIIGNGGILVVYLIIMGDVISGSSEHLGVLEQLLGGEGWWNNRKLIVLIILVIVLAPLCALEKIDSLSLSSAASVALAVIFVIVACVIASMKLIEGKIETPRMVPNVASKQAILDLLVVIPIMTNAYVCHFNVPPIYNELSGRSPQKMNKVGRITALLCVVVYALTATSGYLLFGEKTDSDVLANFDKDLGIPFSSILNYIVRIGYVLHLMLVFPVVHFSLRQTVDSLAFKRLGPLSESRKRSLVLTMVLLALTYVGSTMIPNIWVAFKFTGATTGLSVGFIFPSLVALRLDRQGKVLGHGERMLSWSMLTLALVVSVIGVIGNVYGMKGHSD
ncbi:hypothetical protein AMTRI_Chr13g90460 [Amborella trichopoda]